MNQKKIRVDLENRIQLRGIVKEEKEHFSGNNRCRNVYIEDENRVKEQRNRIFIQLKL